MLGEDVAVFPGGMHDALCSCLSEEEKGRVRFVSPALMREFVRKNPQVRFSLHVSILHPTIAINFF
jgi:hypothetical protein